MQSLITSDAVIAQVPGVDLGYILTGRRRKLLWRRGVWGHVPQGKYLDFVLPKVSLCSFNSISWISESFRQDIGKGSTWYFFFFRLRGDDLKNESTERIKGHSQLCDRADLDTTFVSFEMSLPQPEIK